MRAQAAIPGFCLTLVTGEPGVSHPAATPRGVGRWEGHWLLRLEHCSEFCSRNLEPRDCFKKDSAFPRFHESTIPRASKSEVPRFCASGIPGPSDPFCVDL